MFAILPGHEKWNKSIGAKIVQGLFITHPVSVGVAIYFIRFDLDSVPIALLLALVPLAPIGLTALILFIYDHK
ncbi:hypothetical protein HQQ94_02765 [Shewanella sp. VB17]|uniref:hypothetical protein n=1 Tax=Shewanella sp. VB17 TaxID=2739432 RepID=UPI001567440B|nr:hypothetical protein [Shewanella sp. VB17]NRD72176.1 hypothetical protein [Shewanella sp. VB17]